MNRCIIVCVLLCVAILSIAHAQDPQPPPAPSTTSSANAPAANDAERGPVVLPPPSEKAVRFYKSGVALWLFQNAWDLIVPLVILFTGFSAKLRNGARSIGRYWYFTIAIYVALFGIVNFLINLPLAYYAQFVRMHAFELSNQTFAKWILDAFKGLGVEIVAGILFLWVPYLLLKKSPKRWWLYTGLLMYVFYACIFIVKPVVIDPLFNDFGPMQDKALEQKILALADRAGIEGSRVFEVNKSEDTKTINAYVTGIGPTARIVLWDTAIKGLTEEQLLYVMAHEMGHYVLKHAYTNILFVGSLMMLGFYVIHCASGWIIGRYKDRLGFDNLADIASYPLILFLLTATMLVLDPITNTYSRYHEHESDRFGLELTENNYAGASAFKKLYEDNLGYPNPHPLVKIWRASHPTVAERVEFCNTYRPWAEGQPLKYGHLFKAAEAARN
ncbi:MAG: M48 family metallopeptidase [Candidatus Hydrogenedentes bacterium]|nr:M48 family metallopeptidase [Candidatus Hydrogenedentota bacterium]